MESERSGFINIGGEQYELILTTKATKAIASRYGGLENLGENAITEAMFKGTARNVVSAQDEASTNTQGA